jgi:hypothetical protein
VETFDKDQKYLLVSHLQKAIRRGLPGEAAWAAAHLHRVDRAHLAARLAVIAVEDVGAGDPAMLLPLIDEDRPWGARRFGYDKTPDDRDCWMGVARRMARSVKDRTPCEWIACRHWLPEFVATEGPWHVLDPHDSIDKAYDRSRPWWNRGLHAWRAAGTHFFPAGDLLPEVDGAWEDWCAMADDDVAPLMERFGRKQIEPHPVFLPLAVADRRFQHDPPAQQVAYQLDGSPRLGPWLAAAIDKHTGEGARALRRCAAASDLGRRFGYERAAEMLGRLQFWTEGGHVDRGWSYPLAQTIMQDTRARCLAELKITPAELMKGSPPPAAWNEARSWVLDQEIGSAAVPVVGRSTPKP